MEDIDNMFNDPAIIEEVDIWNHAEARGLEIQKKLILLPLFTDSEVQNLIEGFNDPSSKRIKNICDSPYWF
jgi:hypothetical protein